MDKIKKRFYLIRFTKILIAILIIPTLIFGVFCTIVLSNTKLNGGIPSIFGYYVVQIPDNSFYNPTLKLYHAGDYRMFQSIQSSDYRVGDMIAYYVGTENAEDQIVLERYEWVENFSQNIQNDQSTPLINNISTYQNLKTNSEGLNFSAPNTTEFSAVMNGGAEVKLGKIEKIGIGYDAEEVAYVIYSVYGNPTDLIQQPILALSVIGLSVSSSDFFINLILFCSSTFSFVLLLLIPCALLITLQITNLTLGAEQLREEKNIKKKFLLESEIKSQMEEFYSFGKMKSTEVQKPENVIYPKNLKKAKNKKFKSAGYEIDLASFNITRKNPQQFYNKEQLEKIRKDLLSNKKYQSEIFDYEDSDDIEKLKQLEELANERKVQEKHLASQAEEKNKITSNEEIPEDIIKTFGLKVDKLGTEDKKTKPKDDETK